MERVVERLPTLGFGKPCLAARHGAFKLRSMIEPQLLAITVMACFNCDGEASLH